MEGRMISGAFTKEFMRKLIQNTIDSLKAGKFGCTDPEDANCMFVNWEFFKQNKNVMKDLLVNTLKGKYPNCQPNDFVFLNDFVVGKNIPGVEVKTGFYVHRDGTDSWVGPCYNIWIPLRSKEYPYDEKPLMKIMEMGNAFEGRKAVDYSMVKNDPLFQEFIVKSGLPEPSEEQFYYWKTAAKKYEGITLEKLDRLNWHIQQREVGDALVFNSDGLHQTGDSTTPRLAYGVKYVYLPEMKMKMMPVDAPVIGWNWITNFLGIYLTTKSFESYEEIIKLNIKFSEKNRRLADPAIRNSMIAFLEKVKSETYG
jgi:hypothetical protein